MCENSASIVAGETSAKKISQAHLGLCLRLDTQFSQLPKLMLCCIFNEGGKRRTDLEVGVSGVCDTAKRRFPVLMK